jgi:hypothetical protein
MVRPGAALGAEGTVSFPTRPRQRVRTFLWLECQEEAAAVLLAFERLRKKVGKKGGSKAHGPAGRGFGGRRDRLTRLEALGC